MYKTDEEWNQVDDCLISTQEENASKMPIPYMKNGTRLVIMYPDIDGLLNIKHDITFKLLCANSRFKHKDLNQTSEVEVKCVVDAQLLYNNRLYRYNDFECESMPKSELVVTDKKCQSNNYTVAEVGFRSDEGLIVLYKICFDLKTKNALYTWYDARVPYYDISQKYKKRPSFHKSKELYGSIDVNKKYTVKEQVRNRIIYSVIIIDIISKIKKPGRVLFLKSKSKYFFYIYITCFRF
jgi:hypothetical protein